MKIISVTIRNFRGYEKATTIDFNDFTVFIGKNDVGKSTILEALDLFFNEGKGTIKMEKTELCEKYEMIEATYSCEWNNSINIDAYYLYTGRYV